MTSGEYLSFVSALIDNISADFILSPPLKISKKKPERVLNEDTRSQVSKSDVFYKQKPPLKKRTKNIPLLPSQYKQYINSCNKCANSQVKYASIPDTLPQSPYIMIITDAPLDKKGYQYTSKIMLSISLDTSLQSDVYITPLAKCEKENSDEVFFNCFSNLVEEIKLVSPISLLIFGKQGCELFRKNGAESEVVWRGCIPIILVDKMPLDIENDSNTKKTLWNELRKFRDYYITL